MSKLDAQNSAFHAVLSRYYETGELDKEFYTHLDGIRRFTSNLPQFKNYSSLYRQGMEEKAQDRAINALLEKKFDIQKRNPISFFGNLYYNTYLNWLRDNKARLKKEKGRAEPIGHEREPVAYDPVSLFAPFISWVILDRGNITERFLVFASVHYPELTPEDAKINQSALCDYLATFPNSKEPKKQKGKISKIMEEVTKLRRDCNRLNDMRDKGLRNNLVGLKNIIEKRLKIGKE